LDAQEHESEYEQKTIDWNLEQRVNNIISPLEDFNANDLQKIIFHLFKKEVLI
jgi:hypothetical protein